MLGGLLAPFVGAFVPAKQAVALQSCTVSIPDGGTAGGYTWTSYITTWVDPNVCGSGGSSRHVAYDYYLEAQPAVTIDPDTLRYWNCGGSPVVAPNPPSAVANQFAAWSGWGTWHNCGFQADMTGHFFKSGVLNDWTYTQH